MNKLKQLRKERNLTIEELYRISGVAPYTITNFENHKSQIMKKTALKLAKALKVELYELCDEGELNTKKDCVQTALERSFSVIRENSLDFEFALRMLLRMYEGDKSNIFALVEAICLSGVSISDDRCEALLEAIHQLLKH